MISHLQHDFLSGRSCITKLLPTLHSIGQLLDKSIQSDIRFLDFAKAFYSVDHSILLEKLKAYGISGNLHRWLTNYVIEGASSKWSPVTPGVPKGSILGPMLFFLFINNIPDVLSDSDSMSLYADDAKLFRTIKSLDDCAHLQETLSKSEQWSQEAITFVHFIYP